MTDKCSRSTQPQDQLAKSKEAQTKILAEHKEREKWMPTPTQEENDAAAVGQGPVEKKPDGSPVEETPTKQMEAAREDNRQLIRPRPLDSE